MDKGKSSHVSFVESLVTSQEIADRSDMAIKGLNVRIKGHHGTTWHQHVPGKLTKTQAEPLEA
jgi:hypothetical protein